MNIFDRIVSSERLLRSHQERFANSFVSDHPSSAGQEHARVSRDASAPLSRNNNRGNRDLPCTAWVNHFRSDLLLDTSHVNDDDHIVVSVSIL